MRAHAQSGYSLVELLVVLALLGLIAVAINGGIRFGARAWERTEGAVEGMELARGGHAVLRNLVSRLYPRAPDANASDAPPAFTGERDRMRFHAVAPAAFAGAGIMQVTLETTRGRDGVALWITHKAETGPAVEQREILLADAKYVTFSYARIADGAILWEDSWGGQPGVPVLIRIRAAFASGSGIRWPDLIVRPRIDKDAACIYDPVSFGCRRG